jgi:protein-S-isoprenylcysteine O-methyltransferase Ste14
MFKRIAQVTVYLVVYAAIFFGISGRFDIPQAWAFFGCYFVYTVIMALVIRNPALFKERSRGMQSVTQSWDRVILTINALGMVGMYIVAALDIGRYGWGPRAEPPVIVGGFCLFYTGGAILAWTMRTNTFFSTVVRIQAERGHRAITTGPYRIVRHPGYVGMLMMIAATPLALGSYWAFIPAAIAGAAMVVRTGKEDALLHRELEGYTEFAQRTRSRLIPGVW